MRCWFKRTKSSEWTQGIILGYVAGGAAVKVDRKGEVLTVPLDLLSAHDNQPGDDDPHYIDPRYVVEHPETATRPPAKAAVTR